MYPNYNNQFYMQDLQGMRDRIDRQLQQMQQMPQPSINQTFQLAPSQNNSSIKYAENLDEVKKELVLGDTLFINKSFTTMWLKNARGETKTYEVKEMVIINPSELKIKELTGENEVLRKEIESLKESITNASEKKSNIQKSSKP